MLSLSPATRIFYRVKSRLDESQLCQNARFGSGHCRKDPLLHLLSSDELQIG